jgi:hypothetical protein
MKCGLIISGVGLKERAPLEVVWFLNAMIRIAIRRTPALPGSRTAQKSIAH